MSKRKRDNPGRYVQVGDCRERHEKIELALWGKDGRGGMVKDIADVKMKLEVATGVIRTIVIPIVVPLVLAGIFYWLGKAGL